MRSLLRLNLLAVFYLICAATNAAAQSPPLPESPPPLLLSRPSGLLRVPPAIELERKAPSLARQNAPSSRRGVGRVILGGAVGAVGGLFAGGYLGAVIEGDGCHCDDPGLKGALIGAPVGTVAGAILGALYLF